MKRVWTRGGAAALLGVVAACGGGSGTSGDGEDRTPIELGTVTYVGGSPGSTAAGYLDGDGHLDMVVADTAQPRVRVLLGHGDGTFTPIAPVGYGLSSSIQQVALAYFDVDPYLDLAVLDSGEKLHVFLGLGDGTFTPVLAGIVDFAPYILEDMTASDFDEDGVHDLAITSSHGVVVMLCNGDGTFTETPASPIAFGTELSYIAAGSMSTSHGDLLVADRSDNTVTHLYGNGMGDFVVGTSTPVTAPNVIRIADARAYVFTSGLVGGRLHVLRLVGGQLQDIAGSPVSFPEYVGLDIQVVRTSTFDRGLIATFFKNPELTGLVLRIDLDALGAPLDIIELGRPPNPWFRGCAGDFVEGDPLEDAAFALPYAGEVRVVSPE